MKTLIWKSLSSAQRQKALARPASLNTARLISQVDAIINRVRRQGDAALLAYAKQFDQAELRTLKVSKREFEAAEKTIDPALKAAMLEAISRIRAWHKAGMSEPFSIKTAPGVHCGRIIRPIESVGLYCPAGSAPLPSTVMMLGIPAHLAGCKLIVLCSPPQADGRIDASILVAARLCGIDRIYKVGGAQAIAAMAFGTQSIPRCDKLFGPGNAFVSAAKQRVQSLPDGPAIDMPAGPSEVLVIADAGANPAFIAADLLAQAEHGPDSQVLCLSDDAKQLQAVKSAMDAQLQNLPRRAIIGKALGHARFIQTASIDEAIAISNRYAPEHLILAIDDAENQLARISAAGSVFLGAWASESLGDYCSGTNHTLPTNGHARAYSGVSVASFQRFISTQRVSQKGNRAIGPCAVTLARCEGLDAHANAVSIRLEAGK
jgi:histidinol dehydrogenase